MSEKTNPVVILAPTGRDSLLISEALRRVRLPTEVCGDLDQFVLHLQNDAGAGLMAQEALRAGSIPVLCQSLREQPAWSDVPLILMTGYGGLDPAFQKLWDDGLNITMLERPVRMQTLASAISSALRQRRRQYELRDRLAEQQRTEERLRQTQKLESLGILAGGIAHDFNNLLTGIIGNVSLALERELTLSPRRKYLEDAIQASERAAGLTRQLLAYSGKGRLSVESVNLSNAVSQINALIQTSIPKNVQVTLNLVEELPTIEADPMQLQQIAMNLIINGAEAIAQNKPGLVTVETGQMHVDETYLRSTLASDTAKPGKYVYLDVRDNGCGIEQAALAKIFDPFYTTKFLGRGLGLAAVLGIVRGHHGALKLESTPGKGSSFRVLFPAKDGAQTRQKVAVCNKDLSGSGTILVVDDEEIVRKIARNTLEKWGYTVLLAENGRIALDLFESCASQISLVLLDLTMPVMNGEETFKRMQSIRPDVKAVLSSGYDETDALRRFHGSGLAGFLQKPYTASKLAETVKRVFENRRRI